MSNPQADGPHKRGPRDIPHPKRMVLFLRRWGNQKHAPPTMGMVPGPAGMDETIAISSFLVPPPGTGNDPTKNATPRPSAEALLHSLSEITRNQRADTMVAMANHARLQLMLVDEADQLNEEHFRGLRVLCKKMGCHLVLVGIEEPGDNR